MPDHDPTIPTCFTRMGLHLWGLWLSPILGETHWRNKDRVWWRSMRLGVKLFKDEKNLNVAVGFIWTWHMGGEWVPFNWHPGSASEKKDLGAVSMLHRDLEHLCHWILGVISWAHDHMTNAKAPAPEGAIRHPSINKYLFGRDQMTKAFALIMWPVPGLI